MFCSITSLSIAYAKKTYIMKYVGAFIDALHNIWTNDPHSEQNLIKITNPRTLALTQNLI